MTVATKERERTKEGAGQRPRVIPDTMIAAAIDRFGPPEVLTPHTLPVPEVGPTEILIQMHAAGVGMWDTKIRDGTWAPKNVRFPLVLGTDGAGIVAAKGARVRRFEVGDRVWAYSYMNPKGGFYAQFVVVDGHNAGHAPAELDLMHAGTACVTAMTALQGIDDHLRVRAGDLVLIFGASGAVGTHAVQFAKRRGATVVGTATGSDAQRLVRRLGAEAVIDARDPTALTQLEELAPRGLAAVLALAGGNALEGCIDLVRDGGRVAYPDGVEPPPRQRRNIEVIEYDAVPGPREFTKLAQAVVDAHLRVPIPAAFPLERASDAHQRVEQGHVLGRVGLRIHRRGR
jgi:NADPH2:quinone reductase